MIHETAIIGPDVQLGQQVSIGPYTVVEDNVTIGNGTRIGPHVHLSGHTTIGEDVRIHAGAVIGDEPQDFSFKGETSFCTIGDRTIIREYATIHRAQGDGNTTQVGADCMIMGFVHVGHNVSVGSHCVLANNAGLAGHVVVEDNAIISVGTGIHQFCRVGTLSMTGPYMKITQDIPPYVLVENTSVMGVNTIGLRRNGVDADARKAVKAAVKSLFFSDKLRADAIAEVKDEYGEIQEVRHLVDFVTNSKRGILRGNRR